MRVERIEGVEVKHPASRRIENLAVLLVPRPLSQAVLHQLPQLFKYLRLCSF